MASFTSFKAVNSPRPETYGTSSSSSSSCKPGPPTTIDSLQSEKTSSSDASADLPASGNDASKPKAGPRTTPDAEADFHDTWGHLFLSDGEFASHYPGTPSGASSGGRSTKARLSSPFSCSSLCIRS